MEVESVIVSAAAQGQLEFLQWVWTLQPPMHSMREAAVARAATSGSFYILQWLLVVQMPAHRYLLRKIFVMAVAHQNYCTLSLMASLGLRLAEPDLPQSDTPSLEQLSSHTTHSLQQLAMCLTSAKKGDPLWQAIFKEALQASPWTKPPLQGASGSQQASIAPADDASSHNYTDLLSWLLDLANPAKASTACTQHLFTECRTIVPIQLAAQGLKPCLPWTPVMHRLAGGPC